MKLNKAELTRDGRRSEANGVRVDGHAIAVRGRLLRRASIDGEEWTEREAVEDPGRLLRELTEQGVKADIFTFAQRVPAVEPRFPYRFEWDNVAAIPLSTYDEWWKKRLPQKSRNNVRRAAKIGVVVRSVPLDDALVRSIQAIYNETPIRQGKPFAHYGMTFEAMRAELHALEDRSEIIGAFFGEELIGFIKLVYMEKVAGLLHILTMSRHFDKRATNALMAKAVEVCCERRMRFLVFGRYFYGNKSESSLLDFKRHNGFERIDVPRYYVALTARGRFALAMGMHVGLLGRLPGGVLSLLLRLRGWFFRTIVMKASLRQRERMALATGLFPDRAAASELRRPQP